MSYQICPFFITFLSVAATSPSLHILHHSTSFPPVEKSYLTTTQQPNLTSWLSQRNCHWHRETALSQQRRGTTTDLWPHVPRPDPAGPAANWSQLQQRGRKNVVFYKAGSEIFHFKTHNCKVGRLKNQLLNLLNPLIGVKKKGTKTAPFITSRAHLAGNFFDVFERENELIKKFK